MKLKNLETKFLGRNYCFFDKIDSTQKEIWRRINENIENGILISASIQTGGIGTHGRTWYTENNGNIAFSFFLNVDCNIKKLNGITIDIAKILSDVIFDLYKIELLIKEPNDLYYNGKKVGGILTESKIINENVRFIVVGIGINIVKQDFNSKIKDIATSLGNEFDIEFNNDDIITQFCNRFEKVFLERIDK